MQQDNAKNKRLGSDITERSLEPTQNVEDMEDMLYNKKVREGMSDVSYSDAMDKASENEFPPSKTQRGEPELSTTAAGGDPGKVQIPGIGNEKYQKIDSPAMQDQRSISGSEPDTEIIEETDTLERAQDVGEQLKGETQELGLGEDIDRAEQSLSNH